MKKRGPLIMEFVSITDDLSDDDVDMLLTEARRRARISVFLNRIKKSSNPPKMFDPNNCNTIDQFIQIEWISKNFDPYRTNRDTLAAYDMKLLEALEKDEMLSSRYFPKVNKVLEYTPSEDNKDNPDKPIVRLN